MSLTTHYTALQDQTARNRLNQRAFRSRRQQYIKELEEKLRAHEQAGVQATSQVQMAARVVARENAVLRTLVRDKTGCSEQQLNSYLSSALWPVPEEPGETLGHILSRNETSLGVVLHAGKKESPAAECHLVVDYHLRPSPSGSAAPIPQPQPYIGGDRKRHDDHTQHVPSDKAVADLDDNESTTTDQDMAGLESHRSFDFGSAGIDENNMSDFDRQQGPSMSCEEAAKIISSISTMDSSSDIREQLGCTSVGTCNVDNMQVFQIMGQSI